MEPQHVDIKVTLDITYLSPLYLFERNPEYRAVEWYAHEKDIYYGPIVCFLSLQPRAKGCFSEGKDQDKDLILQYGLADTTHGFP